MSETLSDLQKKTLSSIKNDINNKQNMSIRECAYRNFVSIGFLTKLAKKLGYSGYKEMVFSLSSKRYEATVECDKKYIFKYILNYSDSLQSKFNELLLSSKDGCIHCEGSGYSLIAIDYICKRTSKNGYKTIYTEAINEVLDNHNKMLVIAITNTGETETVVHALESCKSRKIPIIVFTRNDISRAAKIADLLILVGKIENEDLAGINSFIGNTINCFEILFSNITKSIN